MTNWFYADHSQQRRGPVSEDQLRTAYQQQQIAGSNLVWTEGMPGWQPLASVAGQLGISIAAGPPPLPFGGAQPVFANANGIVLVKSSGGTSGWVIAAIIGVVGLFGLAIMAAIALPAYQDYTVRARLSGAIYDAKSQRIVVDEFYQTNQTCPETSDMNFADNSARPGPNPVQSREMSNRPDGSCAMTYTFTPTAVPGGELHTLTLVRDTDAQWRYESTVPLKYLPSELRNSTELN
jgi:type IV pilus assembly protein PilA